MVSRTYKSSVSKDWVLTLSKTVINEDNGFSVGDQVKVEIRIDPEGNVIWSKKLSIPHHMKVRIPRKLYVVNPSVDLFVTVIKEQE